MIAATIRDIPAQNAEPCGLNPTLHSSQKSGGVRWSHAARDQRMTQRQRQPGLLRHRLGQPFGLDARTHPAATGQRGFDIQERARCHRFQMPDPRVRFKPRPPNSDTRYFTGLRYVMRRTDPVLERIRIVSVVIQPGSC